MRRYDQGYGEDRRRHWPVAIAIAVVVAALTAGAYMLGSTVGSGDPAAGEPTAAAPPAPMAPPEGPPRAGNAEPSGDPVATALAWLVAYRTLRFDDATPTDWIDHVRPVVTAHLAGSYEQYRGGSAGADWGDFVDQKCTSTVEDANAVVPDEAPRTKTTVSVQVAGVLRTRCQAQNANTRPDEDLAATLTLVKGSDGLWRVDKRLY